MAYKIKDLVTDPNNFPEIIPNDIMQKIKEKEDLHFTGEKYYENYGLLEDLPKGKPFYILEDMEEHNESGDITWCFCIAIKYYNKWYCLTDQG